MHPFLRHIQQEVSSWDFMLLQEITAFENEVTMQLGGRQLFLAPSSCGAKGDGILIHNRWTSMVKEFHTNGDSSC